MVTTDELRAALPHIIQYKTKIRAKERPNPLHLQYITSIGMSIVQRGISSDTLTTYEILAAILAVNLVSKDMQMPKSQNPAILRKDQLFIVASKRDGVGKSIVHGNLVITFGIFASRMPIRKAKKLGLVFKHH